MKITLNWLKQYFDHITKPCRKKQVLKLQY